MFHLSLINSSVLVFSLLAILPILIHLFSKKKPFKVVFSSIKFIVESQSSKKRKFNLLNLILLIIRILIILLFFFALSRPALKGLKSKNHSKTAVAIIIDNSYSMNYSKNGSTDLEKAKIVATKLNGFFKKNDLVAVYTRSEKWNNFNSITYSGTFPVKILESIKITPSAENLDALFNKVNLELKDTGYSNRKIFFISDLQKEKISFDKCKINVIPIYQQSEKNNLSCENAKYEMVWKNNALHPMITSEIKNYSSQKQNDIVCELILDGVKISEKVVSLDKKQVKKIFFPLLINKEGFHKGFVLINDERLDFDNKAYYSFQYKIHHQAAIITDNTNIPIPLISALISSGFTFQILNSNTVNKEDFQNYDLLVIYKKSQITPSIEMAVNSFKHNILIISDKNISQDFKTFMNQNYQVEFSNFIDSKIQITRFDKCSQITSDLKIGSDFVSDFRVVKSHKNELISTPEGGILFKLKKRKFLLNTDIGINKNEFWKSQIFPIIFNRIAMNDELSDTKNFQINEKIRLSFQSITLPDNKKIELNNDAFYPERIGNYSYENKEGEKKYFSVNLNYEESNYQKEAKYPSNFHIISPKFDASILADNDGLEIWRWIFILVLLLLILETIVVLTAQKEIKD